MTPAVPPVMDLCSGSHVSESGCGPPPRDTAMLPCHAGSDRRSTKAGRVPLQRTLASVSVLEFGESSESEQPILVRSQSTPGLSPVPIYEASRRCLSSLECQRALHRGPSQPVSRADVGRRFNPTQRRESSAEKRARLFF